MKRLLTIGITLVAGLSLSACSNESSTSSKSSSSASTSKKSSVKSVSLSKYDAINIGDHGSSEKSVKSQFGKSTIETETEIPGAKKKATQYTWNNVDNSLKGASVNVQFIDGIAVGKGYVDASNSTKVTDSKYKDVQNGAEFNTVKKQLGTPTGEIVSEVSSVNSQVLTYTNGSKSLSFTFMNNKLMSKSKTDLGQSN